MLPQRNEILHKWPWRNQSVYSEHEPVQRTSVHDTAEHYVSFYYVHWGGKNRYSCVNHGRSVAHCCVMLCCTHQQYCHERCLLVYRKLAPATLFASPFHYPKWKHRITIMFSCKFCPFCLDLLHEFSQCRDFEWKVEVSYRSWVGDVFVRTMSCTICAYGVGWRPLLALRCGWPDNSLVEGKFSVYQTVVWSRKAQAAL
jgi:hypothetical protein